MDIEDTCARKNLEFPGLDGAFEGTQDIEATKDVPEVAQAICTIVAAASHLTALVQPAQTSMMAAIMQFNVSAALFTAEALSVTEILRDVGNTASGMNVVDIASRAGTSPKKLAHVLRLLATEHILWKSKDKYTAPCSPMPVMVQGLYVLSQYTRPRDLRDYDSNSCEMVSWTSSFSHVIRGFDWHSVPESAIVVDVGGGVGRASLPIARTFQFWKAEFPEALRTGRTFSEHSVQGADVYLLRSILHDWSDVYCAKILNRLREAARPRSKLVVVDAVLSYAVQSDVVLLANLDMRIYGARVLDDNGQERTLPEFERLFEESGWRLESVKRPDMSYQSFIVAVPSDVPMN
ncbi:S-adenosyl-L-methionine-dependent methyltransferase [Mucidula mucida]|nr:S-adenosyl-L-methionine-dependent methyltransferase [Mucidula mucida]